MQAASSKEKSPISSHSTQTPLDSPSRLSWEGSVALRSHTNDRRRSAWRETPCPSATSASSRRLILRSHHGHSPGWRLEGRAAGLRGEAGGRGGAPENLAPGMEPERPEGSEALCTSGPGCGSGSKYRACRSGLRLGKAGGRDYGQILSSHRSATDLRGAWEHAPASGDAGNCLPMARFHAPRPPVFRGRRQHHGRRPRRSEEDFARGVTDGATGATSPERGRSAARSAGGWG